MATIQAAKISYTLEDTSKTEREYWLYVPTSQLAPTDDSLALCTAHTDVLRPLMCGAIVKRASIAIPYAIADPATAEPDAQGRLCAMTVQFKLRPGRTVYAIPAYRLDLLDDPDGSGYHWKRTRADQRETATAALTAAWHTGLAGIRPVSTSGATFTHATDGLLVTKRRT